MSFLANTNVKDNDIDDLEDGELGDVPVPKNTETKSSSEEIKTSDKPVTAEERRAELKKKSAAKRKALRNGGRNKMNIPTTTDELQNMLQNPQIINMMKKMMEGDNLEQMMKNINPEKLGLDSLNFDSNQLNQVAQNMKMAKNSNKID